MKRGEVWWHEAPGSKRRPALVLTRSEAVERLFDVIERRRCAGPLYQACSQPQCGQATVVETGALKIRPQPQL